MALVCRGILYFSIVLVFLCSSCLSDSEKIPAPRIRTAPQRNLESVVIGGSGTVAGFDSSKGRFQEFNDRKAGNARVSVSTVAWLTLAMAAATGLGAVPFFFIELEPQYAGVCNGMAAGVMLAASFDLVEEGQNYGSANWVVFGILAGGIFILLCKKVLEQYGSEPLYAIPYIKCKSPPRILVILNPRSGHGRSSKVFHNKVEPIFKLAGFEMEVVKTEYAGHARELASTVEISTCPDGIVCVGGDGIVNEVLNGLLSRDNQKEALSIPIGIIPAGSDNSLVWTILGVRDPISAAMAIVKGGLTSTDVLAVEWIQSGAIHYGSTVSYFGFLSDVLELSEKYQKRFGPLRYFVAGFLKFLCLPKYSFELEYLPTSKKSENPVEEVFEDQGRADMSELYADIMRRSRKEGIPRVSSLSSIDSLMSPNRTPIEEMDTVGRTPACSEPSDYVRGIDPKTKRLSSGKGNLVTEPDEVLHPQPHLSANSNWPRTRSKSRTDKTWADLSGTNDTRGTRASVLLYDKEDISSTVSDPGPVWDAEPGRDTGPKWDAELNWEAVSPVELPVPPDDIELGTKKEPVPSLEDKWVVKKGRFLAVLVCNHSCKTVQSLSSQVVAPKAIHDDNSLDLLLVGGSGRLRLLRFLISLQFGKHIALPYVEYVKVKSVKIKPGTGTHNGCGIDGELLRVKGQVMCSLLPTQCRLIGRPTEDCK